MTGNGFVHYSGSNFAGGDGVFSYEEDDETKTIPTCSSALSFNSGATVFRKLAKECWLTTSSFGCAWLIRLCTPHPLLAQSPRSTPPATNAPLRPEKSWLPSVRASLLGRLSTSQLRHCPADYAFQRDGACERRQRAAVLRGGGRRIRRRLFQINYQLPFETAAGTATVDVLYDGKLAASEYLNVSAAAPGVFTRDASGQGQAVALNQDFSFNGAARPEARGRFLVVFANGQGGQLLDANSRQLITLPSGAAAPANPLYVTPENPTVTIGGVAAPVAFSGLVAGLGWVVAAQCSDSSKCARRERRAAGDFVRREEQQNNDHRSQLDLGTHRFQRAGRGVTLFPWKRPRAESRTLEAMRTQAQEKCMFKRYVFAAIAVFIALFSALPARAQDQQLIEEIEIRGNRRFRATRFCTTFRASRATFTAKRPSGAIFNR